MLHTVIPALRWVYEYKLDVDYYAECCDVAPARIAYHEDMLSRRVDAIENILNDLECGCNEGNGGSNDVNNGNDKNINYNMPFCVGKENCEFYSVIDKEFCLKKSK